MPSCWQTWLLHFGRDWVGVTCPVVPDPKQAPNSSLKRLAGGADIPRGADAPRRLNNCGYPPAPCPGFGGACQALSAGSTSSLCAWFPNGIYPPENPNSARPPAAGNVRRIAVAGRSLSYDLARAATVRIVVLRRAGGTYVRHSARATRSRRGRTRSMLRLPRGTYRVRITSCHRSKQCTVAERRFSVRRTPGRPGR